MAISDKIKEHRTKCGMTQAQLAEALGVTEPQRDRWREATNEGWRSLYCTNDKSTFYYNILSTSAFPIAKSRKYDIIIKNQRRKVKKVPCRSNLIERR